MNLCSAKFLLLGQFQQKVIMPSAIKFGFVDDGGAMPKLSQSFLQNHLGGFGMVCLIFGIVGSRPRPSWA